VHGTEKDRLALTVADRHSEFEEALTGNQRKYSIREFRLFAEAVRHYIEKTRSDEMMHREVVGAVHGLGDYLRVEQKLPTDGFRPQWPAVPSEEGIGPIEAILS
jgi:hypothetical protein